MMKLLLAQNISRKLVDRLAKLFPSINHVFLLGLETATDKEIWLFAQENGFTIVTQDSDFHEKSLIFGFPPKVVWLRTGNTATSHIEELLKQYRREILQLECDDSLGCLQIF